MITPPKPKRIVYKKKKFLYLFQVLQTADYSNVMLLRPVLAKIVAWNFNFCFFWEGGEASLSGHVGLLQWL